MREFEHDHHRGQSFDILVDVEFESLGIFVRSDPDLLSIETDEDVGFDFGEGS